MFSLFLFVSPSRRRRPLVVTLGFLFRCVLCGMLAPPVQPCAAEDDALLRELPFLVGFVHVLDSSEVISGEHESIFIGMGFVGIHG